MKRTPFHFRAVALFVFLLLSFQQLSAQGLPSAAKTAESDPPVARTNVSRFRARVEKILGSTSAGKNYWGALILDSDTGEALYSLNPDRYFMPASNAKVFTTALALASLGPDFRMRTTIETSGTIDSSGKLSGDLVLVGRGDPNLSNRVLPFSRRAERNGPPEKALNDLVDQVLALGVKRISGDIVADDTYFAPARFPSGWTIDDAVWSYGAAVSAIAINENAVSLMVRPGGAVGAPLAFDVAPTSGWYEIRNDAVTTAAGTEPQLRLSRDPESRVVRLSGTLPLDAPSRELLIAIAEPAEYSAALLMRILQDRGVVIEGHSRAIHADDTIAAPPKGLPQRQVLAQHLSVPLQQDVLIMNKLSLNLHAEMLLRVSAREKAAAMTLDGANAFAEQFRDAVGIPSQDVLLSDGSGLSRGDLVTPRSVDQLLAYVQRQTWGRDFVASLPVAGEDGTLENRMKGTAAAGRIQAKTGFVEHAASLSGYAISMKGEHLIFAIFGNNNGKSARDASSVIDAICVAMVEEFGVRHDRTVPAPGRHAPRRAQQ